MKNLNISKEINVKNAIVVILLGVMTAGCIFKIHYPADYTEVWERHFAENWDSVPIPMDWGPKRGIDTFYFIRRKDARPIIRIVADTTDSLLRWRWDTTLFKNDTFQSPRPRRMRMWWETDFAAVVRSGC